MKDFTDIFTNLKLGKGLPRPRLGSKSSAFSMRKETLTLPRGDTAIRDFNEDLDCVECMTCGDRISIEVLERHREKCNVFCQLNCKPSDTLDTMTDKIKKFQESTKKNRTEFDLNTYVTLNRHIQDLLTENSEKYIVTEKVLSNLKYFYDSFRGKNTAKIYVEKLAKIAEDQLKLMQSIFLNDKSAKIQLLNKAKPVIQKKKGKPMRIDFQKMNQINTINSKDVETEKYSEISGSPRLHSPRENSGSMEDLKHSFLKKCIEAKFQFSSGHPGQNVKAINLYRKALNLKSPVEMWQGFIVAELNNPDNWTSHDSMTQRSINKNKTFAVDFIS